VTALAKDSVREELLPEGEVPRVEDLPALPEAWVTALAKDSVREEFFDGSAPNRPKSSDAVVDEEVYRGLVDLKDNGAPDEVVAARLRKALLELTDGAGSRYDTTRDHVAALMRFHSWGRIGVPKALAELFRAYVGEVGDTRPVQVAEAEFMRFTEGAALIIAATPPSDPWTTVGMQSSTESGSSAPGDDTAAPQSDPSWRRVDLTDLLHGNRELLVPTLFERTDGVCLLYPGMIHSIHGESESGKSLIMQFQCVQLIMQGEDVLYVDFESDPVSVTQRLIEFGATVEAIGDHFHYHQPEVKPDSPSERDAWAEMLSRKYTLAVIDGVTDALGVFGCSTKDNDDVAGWIREVPKVIAARTGAAVVLVDHVTKDTSTRNRYAIGGQAKMAGLTGAAYTVEVTSPLGQGLRGEVVLRIAKDRPGAMRSRCGSFRKSDRTQEVARIIVDSTVDPPRMIIGAPGARLGEDCDGPKVFRPTNLMQRVSEAIEQQPGKFTKNKAVTMAGGKKQHTLVAFDILDREGYLKSERGQSGYTVFSSVKPYRETDDEQSDRYVKPGNALRTD
jgi:AAA domain-containing protein